MDSPRRQRRISLCQPHSTTPHPSRVGVPTRLPDALGCRPSTAGGQGATLCTFPLVPLTREPTCTQAIDPGDLKVNPQACGHLTAVPEFRAFSRLPGVRFPMVGPWFTTPWRLVSQSHGAVAWRFRSPCPSHVPFASSRHRPVPSVPWTPYPLGPVCGPSHTPFPAPPLVPSSHVYNPPGRQQPCGAGPLDPLPPGDRFVRLAQVAPFPPPSLSPVPRPRPNPLGCCAAPSHPSSRVYTPPGRQQPCGAGPLDPHPSGDRFVRLARVAPFPTFSPVPRPRPNPLGCCAAPSHPSSRVYTRPGPKQPCGAGPLDPHPSGHRFVRLARVAPLPPPLLTPVPPPMLS